MNRFPFYKVRSPALPLSPFEYDQRQQDQFQNALRIYFNRLDESLTDLSGVNGGSALSFPQGSFYDITSQYDGSTTIPYAVKLGATQFASGVSITSRTAVVTGSIAATVLTVTAVTSGRLYPGQTMTGIGVSANSYHFLQLSSTETPIANSPTFVSGGAPLATTFVVNDVTGLESRQFISGTGLPANTRIVAVNTLTKTITVSAAFTLQAAGSYVVRPYGYRGTYSCSPSQTVASTTITMALPSMMTFTETGIYNVEFSLQFTNTDSQDHDVDVWFKKNDVDIPDSNSQFTVPSKHGAVNGHLIAALNFFSEVQAGDVIEIVWHTANSSVFIEAIPPQSNPIRPATPSAIATVSFVSALNQ